MGKICKLLSTKNIHKTLIHINSCTIHKIATKNRVQSQNICTNHKLTVIERIIYESISNLE